MKLVTYDSTLLPEMGSKYSTCFDLKSAEDVTINPGEVKLVWLWVKTNFASKIYARSSLPLKKGLMLANSVWIIDEDYRGEIKAMFYNFTDKPVEIKQGERVAQMEPWKDDIIDFIVDKETYEKWDKWEDTERWVGGFGSTGWYLSSNEN